MDAALVAEIRIGNVEAFCREHGVSRRTFYRHRARIAAEGSWSERSRRPKTSPGRTGEELDAWIGKLRADLGAFNGADFIRDALHDIHARDTAAGDPPRWRVPSRSTINRVLARHHLLEASPRKRPRASWRRFAFARPRDCYQIDATEVDLADGRTVVVFDVIDDCTRLLVACHAAPSETADAAITAVNKAITAFGAPAIVLSDNGTAFTSRLTNPNAAPSKFTRTVTAHGSRLIHSSPYHPQTCGKVERHHQTLKRWLSTQTPPTNLPALQRLLDTYREHYNHHRRHSALTGRTTPAEAWQHAPTHGSPQHLPLQTDATVHHSIVGPTGIICAAGTRIGVGTAHRGQPLTTIRDHHRATVYTTDGQPLGHAEIEPGKTYVPLTHHQRPSMN
jgi:putative transposase